MIKREVKFAAELSELPELRAIAGELFVGEIRIETESDPEIADCEYIVFNVSAPADEASSLRKEWYRRTQHILKQCGDKVRLSISAAT